jgi:citrate lyase subunit beta/citryl-CoA lyase
VTGAEPGRPPRARRSWLFLPGADEAALRAGPDSGADVLIQELEDFTPRDRRPEARALAQNLYAAWKAAGKLAAVRINPLDGDGRDDLAAVMAGGPQIVLLPKTADPEQVAALARAIAAAEAAHGIPEGSTEIVPNVETAAGLRRTYDIARRDPRVTACLVASEDMAADLGAERSRDGVELGYVRARFHADCVAAGVVSIDCPYTWRDLDGVRIEAEHARRLGYVAKSAVAPEHCAVINDVLTPSTEAVATARRQVAAFEAARAEGRDRAEVDGHLVELPTYLTAARLIERHEMLEQAADG